LEFLKIVRALFTKSNTTRISPTDYHSGLGGGLQEACLKQLCLTLKMWTGENKEEAMILYI
jgi:hypothetical protein